MECNYDFLQAHLEVKAEEGGQRNVLNFQKYKFDVITSNNPTEIFENYVRF